MSNSSKNFVLNSANAEHVAKYYLFQKSKVFSSYNLMLTPRAKRKNFTIPPLDKLKLPNHIIKQVELFKSNKKKKIENLIAPKIIEFKGESQITKMTKDQDLLKLNSYKSELKPSLDDNDLEIIQDPRYNQIFTDLCKTQGISFPINEKISSYSHLKFEESRTNQKKIDTYLRKITKDQLKNILCFNKDSRSNTILLEDRKYLRLLNKKINLLKNEDPVIWRKKLARDIKSKVKLATSMNKVHGNQSSKSVPITPRKKLYEENFEEDKEIPEFKFVPISSKNSIKSMQKMPPLIPRNPIPIQYNKRENQEVIKLSKLIETNKKNFNFFYNPGLLNEELKAISSFSHLNNLKGKALEMIVKKHYQILRENIPGSNPAFTVSKKEKMFSKIENDKILI